MGIQVKKIGVNLKPSPTLLLLYSDGGKARRREMPLRDLSKDSDCRAVAARLRLRHGRHLEKVPEVRVERLIMLAKEQLKGASLTEAIDKVDQAMAVDPNENLNALPDSELQRRKDLMQLKFEMNSVGKEHPDYVYDRVTDFDGQKQPAAGWDSDTEEEKTPRPESLNETKGKQSVDEDGEDISVPEDEEEDFW